MGKLLAVRRRTPEERPARSGGDDVESTGEEGASDFPPLTPPDPADLPSQHELINKLIIAHLGSA